MATYKIKGARLLRKYRAENTSLSYMALSDAELIASSLGEVAWEVVAPRSATLPAHSGASEESDNENVAMRDSFDAALFCAEHFGQRHRAYANAACYRFALPNGAEGKLLSSIKVRVSCDPYNAAGARVAVYTSDDAEPPMGCPVCRTGSSDDVSPEAQTNNETEDTPATEWYSTNTHVEGVAPRKAANGMWYPNSGNAIITPDGGLTLGKYLFVFILLENYATARNGFLEGAAYANAEFELATSENIEGLLEGEVNDLGALEEPLNKEYSVVTDGTYPVGLNGAEAIQLQRTGDGFEFTEPSQDPGKLYNLNRGELSELLDIPAESITCVNPIYIRYFRDPALTISASSLYGISSYMIAIGGTFDTGTFKELPGLYLYIPDKGLVLRDLSIEQMPNAEASENSNIKELEDFIRKHGGLAMCLGFAWEILYSGSSSIPSSYLSGVYLSLIAKDGTVFCEHGYGSNYGTNIITPVICLEMEGAALGNLRVSARVARHDFKLENIGALQGWRDCEVYCSLGSSSFRPYNSSNRGEFISEVAIAVWRKAKAKISFFRMRVGMSIAFSSNPASKENIYAVTTYVDNLNGPFGGTPTTGVFYNGDSPVRVTCIAPVYGLNLSGATSVFAIAGDFTHIDSKACPGLLFVGLNDEGNFVPCVVDAQNLIPDTYDGFSVWGGISEPSNGISDIKFALPSELFLSGKFSRLGENNISRIACVSVSDIEASANATENPPPVPVRAVKVPAGMGVPAIICNMRGKSGAVLCAVSPRGQKVYRSLHADVTAEESTAGLRVLYGSLSSGALVKADVGDAVGRSALFTVRGDTVVLPTADPEGNEAIVSVPTWQLVTANLVVPFALPAWTARKVKLDWDELANATSGAKLNLWVKDEFVSKYPEIKDSAIYDASASEVDGWRLVGTVDASATSAEFSVSFSGKTATFMLTAYINLDSFVPDGEMALPLGVGAASVDVVSGKASGLDTGWRPNITLLG